MGIFSRLFNKSEQKKEEEQQPLELTTDPNAHHILLAYLRSLWNGEPADTEFEQKNLNIDLNFNLLNLGELILAVCNERDLSLDRVIDFTTVLDVGGEQHLTTLLKRLQILSKVFPENERIILLDKGAAGDRKEILPMAAHTNSVSFVVKFVSAIEATKNDKDHSAIDQEFGYIDEN